MWTTSERIYNLTLSNWKFNIINTKQPQPSKTALQSTKKGRLVGMTLRRAVALVARRGDMWGIMVIPGNVTPSPWKCNSLSSSFRHRIPILFASRRCSTSLLEDYRSIAKVVNISLGGEGRTFFELRIRYISREYSPAALRKP